MVTLNGYPGFTFGCDPELFILNADGVAVTAEGLLPGTKEEPFKVKGGAVQVDGMAAEFNIDPVETYQEFSHNIDSVLKELKGMLPKGYTLSDKPSMIFTPEEWEKAPPSAKILGCTADFNAWNGCQNMPPQAPDMPTLRTASGHIHIGWTQDADEYSEEHMKDASDLVKQLDWFLGAWSTKVDTDPLRRRLYGQAGACRFKTYGVEYRVLSNFWVLNYDHRLEVWNRLQSAISHVSCSFLPGIYEKENQFVIQQINDTTRNKVLEAAHSFPFASAY